MDLGQHWFSQWLVACLHEAITGISVDVPSIKSLLTYSRENKYYPIINVNGKFGGWVDNLSLILDEEDHSPIGLCLSHIQPRAPYDFYHPYHFLPLRPSEAPVGFLRRCCSRGHIRLRAPYGLTRLYTNGLVEWFAGLQGCPVRCSYGHCTGPGRKSLMFSYPTGTIRDPQGCRTTPLWTRKGIDTTKIDKNPARASYLAVQGPYGPCTGCSRAV